MHNRRMGHSEHPHKTEESKGLHSPLLASDRPQPTDDPAWRVRDPALPAGAGQHSLSEAAQVCDILWVSDLSLKSSYLSSG